MPLSATEKYWIANACDLAVVGRLQRLVGVPLWDGWHYWGRLVVEKPIYGTTKQGQVLSYRWDCPQCSFWPAWRLRSEVVGRQFIWFLKREPESTQWRSAGDVYDFGGRDVGDLESYRQHLSRYR